MGIAVTIYCDYCSHVLDGGKSATAVREDLVAKGYLFRIGGRDICASCERDHGRDLRELAKAEKARKKHPQIQDGL